MIITLQESLKINLKLNLKGLSYNYSLDNANIWISALNYWTTLIRINMQYRVVPLEEIKVQEESLSSVPHLNAAPMLKLLILRLINNS